VTDNTRGGVRVPRSGREARQRLERAALELYREHGFDRTTTAEIARRAGVSERTFFHHFPDKREVLFGGEERLRSLLIATVRAVPDGPAPLDVLLRAFCSLEEVMMESRSYAQPRHELIVATPALREREAAKLASLADTVAASLEERGVARQRSMLAAHAGMAAFAIAVIAWYDNPAQGLSTRLAKTFEELCDVCTA
jgi:AcrR family transcriptional regulator